MATCIGCNQEFTPHDPRQKRCKDHCGRKNNKSWKDARTWQEKNRYKIDRQNPELHGTHFIPLDGEAVWHDGKFNYCLLSVGENSIYTDGSKELTLIEIFTFLYNQFLNIPKKFPEEKIAFVGFFLSFDFTHWFKQLPEERAAMLLTREGIAKRQRQVAPHLGPFPVDWNGWEFDLLGFKRLKLRPHVSRGTKNPNKWLYICDAGAFFQTSLLNAARPDKWSPGLIDQADYDLCVKGKALRGEGGMNRELIEYNLAENRILQAMLHEYEIGIDHIGIRLNSNQWFGPGQCSSKWLGTTNTPLNKTIADIIPEECIRAGQASYYGGRFEVFQHGHIPDITYEYDINSAYPAAMRELPNIIDGEWTHKRHSRSHKLPTLKPGQIALYFGGFGHKKTGYYDYHPIGALPHRTEQGRIYYPSYVLGWYWHHEIESGARLGAIEEMNIKESWTFTPNTNERPLAAIATLYEERLRIGKDTPEGKAMKLVYNSAYGKMAQSVGLPKFANPFYASLITSLCRTKILDAVASHPRGVDDLVMIATDGVYFRSEHPGLAISSQLGEWDKAEKHHLTTFLPGIYWDDKTRVAIRDGKTVAMKSRGISSDDLATRLDELDQLFADKLNDDSISYPSLEIPIRFTYLSLRQALIGRNDDGTSKWALAGVPMSGKFRKINSTPKTKRNLATRVHGDTLRYGCLPFDGEPSKPYAKSFGLFDDDDNLIGTNIESMDTDNLGKELSEILRNA